MTPVLQLICLKTEMKDTEAFPRLLQLTAEKLTSSWLP